MAFLLRLCCAAEGITSVTIQDSVKSPQTDFAISEISDILREMNHAIVQDKGDMTIRILVDDKNMKPQAYAIRRVGDDTLVVTGGDPVGTMYGVLDLAEQLTLTRDWGKIEAKQSAPFIEKRGIKFNIPLDGRLPSYDDTGDAAQNNIKEMWSEDFWHDYLDDLARNRYNVLSLWTKHPFPSLIKLKDFPKVALDDVYAYAGEITPEVHKDWGGIDIFDPKNLKLVKRMTIDEKIAFWQHVMQYGHDRGIEIYLFTWNIYVTGAEKYGIGPWDEEAVSYMRACVKEFALTYPHLAGLGVTAGENMPAVIGERTNVQWLRDTYGRGIAEALKTTPERSFRFIFRRHHTNLLDINQDFTPYFPGKVDTSFKYSFAHMYSTVNPPRFDNEYAPDVIKHGYKCWMNLRNDDIFTFRWGDPDYVRNYLTKMATYPIAGFYMGSDGYVWGREFTSKNPSLSGELEVHKHWYREMLWGRLAYDPSLDETFFKQKLATRFPQVNPHPLYAAWQYASQIFPTVSSFHWKGGDSMWGVEGCLSQERFQTVRDIIDCYAFERDKLMNIPDYVDAVINQKPMNRTTPIQDSDTLLELASRCFEQLEPLKKNTHDYPEALKETLADVEAMALLGQYYAHKIKGAVYLHLYESAPHAADKQHYKTQAINSLQTAVPYWKQYADNADSRYKVQLLARTRYLDWKALTPAVVNDLRIVEQSTGALPKIAKVFYREYLTKHPALKEVLKKALEEKGYTYNQVPAWELHGNALGFRIVILKTGDLSYEEFLNDGGHMPSDFETNEYAIVKHHEVYWIIGKNADNTAQGVEAFIAQLDTLLSDSRKINEPRSYYVAKDGQDTHPGTLEQPFRTLNKAARVAQAGDTCSIREGTNLPDKR